MELNKIVLFPLLTLQESKISIFKAAQAIINSPARITTRSIPDAHRVRNSDYPFVLCSVSSASFPDAYTHVAPSAAIGAEVVWNQIDISQRLPLVKTAVCQERTLFEGVRIKD